MIPFLYLLYFSTCLASRQPTQDDSFHGSWKETELFLPPSLQILSLPRPSSLVLCCWVFKLQDNSLFHLRSDPNFPFEPSASFCPTSDALTFCLPGIAGRTAHWLCLFVWAADGLACWLVVEIGGLPVPHVVHLFIHPPAHFARLLFCLFFFFQVSCVSLQLLAKVHPLLGWIKSIFLLFPLPTSRFVISCTLSQFLLFYLAVWWHQQSVGDGTTQSANCLSCRSRDGRDPHLFSVGVQVVVFVSGFVCFAAHTCWPVCLYFIWNHVRDLPMDLISRLPTQAQGEVTWLELNWDN